jgi:hypothetical protein
MSRRTQEIACTLEIEQTHDCFHAHLVLDGDVVIHPGDRVLLQGEPVRMAFGEKRSERRRATLTRAGLLRRAWTRLSARFELSELYDVSFTPRRVL